MYGYTVIYVITKDVKRSIEKMKIRGLEYRPGDRAFSIKIGGQPLSFIILPTDSTINDISHESTHITQQVIDWIGATYVDKEFVAYFNAHVTQATYEYFEKAKKLLEYD